MIAPLRARHRRIFGVLALGLPALLGLALAWRVPPAMQPTLPQALAAPTAQGEPVASGALEGANLGLRVLRAGQGEGARLNLEVEPTGPLRAPDPLLYWSASPAQGALPSDARLLGPLSAAPVQRFPLPAERGQLIVYSLGHAEIVAQGPLPSGAP